MNARKIVAGAILAMPIILAASGLPQAMAETRTNVTAADHAPDVRAAFGADLTRKDLRAYVKEQTDRKEKRRAANYRSNRSSGVRSYGTQYSPNQAVARLRRWADEGRGGYHDQCLRLADDAYGGGARTSTAMAQWQRAVSAGVGHRSDRNPPVGAQMFWITSNPAGHIATYIGHGKVATNMPGGQIEIVDISVMDSWGPYQGWAAPYYR